MSQAKSHSFDPSRLPAYRSSPLERFHPYVRITRQTQANLMDTVDHRFSRDPPLEQSACAPHPPSLLPPTATSQCQEVPDDTLSAERDLPVIDTDADSNLPAGERLGRNKLAVAVSDLLGALQRKYLTINAFKTFLDTQDAK